MRTVQILFYRDEEWVFSSECHFFVVCLQSLFSLVSKIGFQNIGALIKVSNFKVLFGSLIKFIFCCLLFSLSAIFDSFATPQTVALCPWDFPGKNTGVGCHFLLQEIVPVGIQILFTSNMTLGKLLACKLLLWTIVPHL